MEVILCQDVAKIGRGGEIVKVKDGYARNYLLPRQLALVATKENKKKIELQKAKMAAANEANKKIAEEAAEKLAKVSCTVTVEVNDQDKLYGAVTEAEILRALEQEGQKFDRQDLVIENLIEELGIFEIGVRLHPDVIGKFRLWVTKK